MASLLPNLIPEPYACALIPVPASLALSASITCGLEYLPVGSDISILSVYLKKEYANDPAFNKAKIVYSCYDDQFEGSLDSKFASKMVSENISLEDVAAVKEPTHLNINKMAIDYADGIIIHSPQVSQEVIEYAKSSGKPMTSYTDRDTYVETYDKFFDSILEQ